MLKIYGVPISVHTRKVIVAAMHKGLAFETVPVVPVIPGNAPANWRQLSPTGLIPAIDDDGFVLAESMAICAYLDRRHPAAPVYPHDVQAHATTLFFEQYASNTLFNTIVRPLFHEAFVHPKIEGLPTDPARVDDVLGRVVPAVFGYLDSAVGDAFVAGGEATVADWHLASNLVTMQYVGFSLDAARFPRLAAHFGRTIRTPAMQRALREEQGVVQSMNLDAGFLRAVLG